MANCYSSAEYAFIEAILDAKLQVGEGPVDLILNYLGDGLCAWCEREACEGQSDWCQSCIDAFESLADTGLVTE
jgi:hypothetical protein